MKNASSMPFNDPNAAEVDFRAQLRRVHVGVDHLFGALMLVQFAACVAGALWLTPYTWYADAPELHAHVWAAITLGAAATLFPAMLCWRRGGEPMTRYAVAVAQMVVASLLIHISGGRIEMHFHVFVSLAFLAAYRDWRVILLASITIAIDHLARGLLWPASVFGVDQPALWRALEHAGWVVFEDIILFFSIAQANREMRSISAANAQMRSVYAERDRHANEVERLNADLELRVQERTQQLDTERGLLESLIAGLPNAVFWKDTNGVYLGCNQAFADFVQVDDPSGVIGLRDQDLGWEHATLEHKLQVESGVLQTQAPVVDAQVTKALANGLTHDVIASKTVLVDSCGRAAGVVGIYTDVTELNRLRSQLQESDKLQAVGRLAAGIAHEINTPIQAAAANLDFLRAGVEQLLDLAETCDIGAPAHSTRQPPIDPKQIERLKVHAPGAVEDSAAAINRVTEIVRAMRVMSHPGTDAMTATDINSLAQSAATISRSRWKEAAELQLELDPALPLVDCHGSDISQVLLNLIVNAGDAIADHRDEGDPLGKILVRTRAVDDCVVVEVEDTGGGIRPEIRDRLFEPFFTTKEVGRGTGQGLAICYDMVVNKHRGKIEIDSTVGVGSTFMLVLPRESESALAESVGELA